MLLANRTPDGRFDVRISSTEFGQLGIKQQFEAAV